MALTEIPIELSSTPSIVDGGNATAITIDSSEKVTLSGDANPVLEVSRGSENTTNINLKYNTTLTGQLSAANEKFQISAAGSGTEMEFYVNGGKRLEIDTSGNVGIGLTPGAAYKLQVAVATNTVSTGSPAASSIANISGGTTTVGDGVSLQLTNISGAKETAWRLSAVTASGNNGDLVFSGYAGGSTYPERLRIDSTGNLLVGTTSTIPFTFSSGTGAGITSGGTVMAGAAAEAGLFNRVGSDGTIIQLYKAGGIVGSIGTGSSLLTIGTGTGNLVFANALVAPCSDSSAGSSNGVVDLGAGSRRFKDIYLSGGVNFSDASGGVTYSAGNVANTLDDYEEGTWTPVIKSIGTGGMNATFTATNAVYTRVGRMVHVAAYLSGINLDTITGGGYIILDGLPFNASAYGDFVIAYKTGAAGTAGNIIGGYIQTGAAYAYLMRSSGTEAVQTSTDLQMSKAMINITYPAP